MKDIESVLNESGFRGRANEKGEMPLQFCPFHPNRRSPALSLNVKNGFKCYSCGAKGSIWKFLDAIGVEFTSFKSFSVSDLINILEKDDEKSDDLIPRSDTRALECAEFYHEYWESRGFDEQFCRNNRLGYNERRMRVTIPVYFAGKYYGSLQRTVVDDKPKYLIPHNFQRRKLLYEPLSLPSNMSDVDPNILLIAEGSIDSLKANQYGYKSVATLGCLPSREQISLVLNRPEKRKILSLDNDDAGQKALKVWMGTGYPFEVLRTKNKDIADSSKSEVDDAVSESMDVLEYMVWQM